MRTKKSRNVKGATVSCIILGIIFFVSFAYVLDSDNATLVPDNDSSSDQIAESESVSETNDASHPQFVRSIPNVSLSICDPGLGAYYIQPSMADSLLLLTSQNVINQDETENLVMLYDISADRLTDLGIRSLYPQIVGSNVYFFEYDAETGLVGKELKKHDIITDEEETVYVCDEAPYLSLYFSDNYLIWYEQSDPQNVIGGGHEEIYGIECKQVVFSLENMQIYKVFDDYIYMPGVKPAYSNGLVSVSKREGNSFRLTIMDINSEEEIFGINTLKCPEYVSFDDQFLAVQINGFPIQIFDMKNNLCIEENLAGTVGYQIYNGLLLTSLNGALTVQDLVDPAKTIFETNTENGWNEPFYGSSTDTGSYGNRYFYTGYFSANGNLFITRRIDREKSGYMEICILKIGDN